MLKTGEHLDSSYLALSIRSNFWPKHQMLQAEVLDGLKATSIARSQETGRDIPTPRSTADQQAVFIQSMSGIDRIVSVSPAEYLSLPFLRC